MKKDKKNRPKNLNLLTIRLPINALVSILHRVSGMVLFLVLPIFLLAFNVSLMNETNYTTLLTLFNHWFVKLFLIGLSWPFFHHFYAGLRHLAQDAHWMNSLEKARLSGRILFVLVAASVLFFSMLIW